jgi:zinc transporter 5/7
MGSSYVLPVSSVPNHHAHDHGPDGLCSHSHTSSRVNHSPSRSRKEPISGHFRSHNRSYTADILTSSTESSGQDSGFRRHRVPPPLENNSQWKIESTPGGRALISPSAASFDAASTYQPLTASRSRANSHSHGHDHHHHDHHHHHGHSFGRSRFTEFLLKFTPRWPLLHAVVSEKDSRRIFYFMRFVVHHGRDGSPAVANMPFSPAA